MTEHGGSGKGSGKQDNSRRRVSGDIDIRGKVEASLPKDLVEEYKSDNRSTGKRENYRFIVECVTLVCVFVVGVFSYIQTRQAIRSTDAAISAASTARDALHVSERAYLTLSDSDMDLRAHLIRMGIVNSGHIPSGEVVITHHEFTGGAFSPTDPKTFKIEAHWRKVSFPAMPVGSPLSFKVFIPQADESKVMDGEQFVIFAGTMQYKDGFDDTPERVWNFCYESRFDVASKRLEWVPCNPTETVNLIMKEENFPQSELKER